MMVHEPAPEDVMPVGKSYRLAILPGELQLQNRMARGVWIPGRLIRYGEIRAVYRYDHRNWAPLGTALGLWVLAAVMFLVAGLSLTWPGWLTATLCLAPALLVAAAVFRAMRVPQVMLRVDAYTGPVIAPLVVPGFYQRLAARLAEIASAQAAAPPPGAGLAGTVPPPAWTPASAPPYPDSATGVLFTEDPHVPPPPDTLPVPPARAEPD